MLKFVIFSLICLQLLGTFRCTGKFQGETSNGVNDFGVEKRDGAVVTVEETNLTSEAQDEDEQTQAFKFLKDIKV